MPFIRTIIRNRPIITKEAMETCITNNRVDIRCLFFAPEEEEGGLSGCLGISGKVDCIAGHHLSIVCSYHA